MDLDLGEHAAPAVLQALIKVLAAKGILSDDDLNDLRNAHAEAAAQYDAQQKAFFEVLRRNHPFQKKVPA